MAEKNIKGFLVKIWSDENISEVSATLNEKTGEIFATPVDDEIIHDEDSYLEDLYFESEDGNIKYEVCKICQEFIKKARFVEGEGNNIISINNCINGCND